MPCVGWAWEGEAAQALRLGKAGRGRLTPCAPDTSREPDSGRAVSVARRASGVSLRDDHSPCRDAAAVLQHLSATWSVGIERAA